MTKGISIAIALLVSAGMFMMSSCKKTKEDYKVSKLIESKAAQDSLLLQIITVVEEHIPDTVKRADRFLPEHRPFFEYKLNRYDFDCLYKDDKGEYYYFISKPAYGANQYYVGLAGKFKLDDKGEIHDFEESYRMFRMPSDELNKKGMEVYNAFIAGEDLKSFHRDVNVDPYIEFPNDNVAYDKSKLEWYLIKPY